MFIIISILCYVCGLAGWVAGKPWQEFMMFVFMGVIMSAFDEVIREIRKN